MNEVDDEQRFTGYPNPDNDNWMTADENAVAVKEAEDNRAAWELLQKSVDRTAEGEEPVAVSAPAEAVTNESETTVDSPLDEVEVPVAADEPTVETSKEEDIDKEALAQAEREELLRRALEIAIDDTTSLKQLYEVVGTQIYSSENSEKPISQVQEDTSYPDPDLMMLVNGDVRKWLESRYPKLQDSKKWIIYLDLQKTDPWKDAGFAADEARKLRANNQEVSAEAMLAQLGITESDMPPALFNKFQELLSTELQNHSEKVSRYVQSELSSALRSLNNSSEYQIFTDEKWERGFKGALPRALNEYNRLKNNPWVDGEELEQAWSGIFKLRDSLPGIRTYIQSHKEEIWTKYLKAVDEARPIGINPSEDEYAAYREKYEQAAGEILRDSGVDFPSQTDYPEEYRALLNIVTSSGGNWLWKDVIDLRRQGIKSEMSEGDQAKEKIEIDWDQVKDQSERAIRDGYALATSDKPRVSPSKKVTIAVSHRNYSSKYPEHAMAGFAEGSALKTIFGDQETLTKFMLDLTLDEANELFDQLAHNFVVTANVEKDIQNAARNTKQKSVSLGDRFMEGVDTGFGSTLGAEYYQGPYTYNESELTREQIIVHAAGYLIGLARRESSATNQKLMERFDERLAQLKKQGVTRGDVLAFAEKQYSRVPGVNEGESLVQALGIEQATV